MPEDVRLPVVGEPVLADEHGGVERLPAAVEAHVPVVVERDELKGLAQVDVAAPVEAGLFGVRVPGEVEVHVGHGTQHDLEAAVREPVREILGAPAGHVVPDVGAPAAVGEARVRNERRLAVALRLAHGDLLPARECARLWPSGSAPRGRRTRTTSRRRSRASAASRYAWTAGERSQTPAGTSSPPMCRSRSGTPASAWIATRSDTTLLDERVRGLERGVHHVVVEALGRRVHASGRRDRSAGSAARRPRLPPGRSARAARLHRLDRGARVARHLDLGHHLDVARGRVAQDLDVVGPRVEAAAPRPVDVGARAVGGRQPAARIERVAAAGADRR